MQILKPLSTVLFASLLLSCNKPPVWHATDISGALPDLEFSLVGTDGQIVKSSKFLGKPVLLFFGFTNCPHICPMTLTQLSMVIDKMGTQAEDIQVLLVTVDPGRDTPEVMRKFTNSFGSWLAGLTGTEEELSALQESYGVYAAMESSQDKGEYNVMHTAAVFVFDAQGRVRLLLSDVSNADLVVADLRQLLDA